MHGNIPVPAGSEAFWQSEQIDLDKAGETAGKKTASGSGGGDSLVIGSWREPLCLTLDTSTIKKLDSRRIVPFSHSTYANCVKNFTPWGIAYRLILDV